jgi:hypothetical protein
MGLELRILTDENNNTGFTLDVKQSEDFPFTLNMGIADIEDIAKTKSTFSKNFRIPATPENNTNLESIYYSSTSDEGNAKKRNVCIVIEDGTPISKGFLKIKNVIDGGVNGREYEAVYYGDNFGWIKYFRDTSIRDLDFSAENHTYDANTVEASWKDSGAGTTPATSDDRSYTYPVVSYGAFSGKEVKTTDLRPAMFIKSVLNKAWDSVLDGSTYNINSTFLDGTLSKSLIMPFTGGDFVSDANKVDGEDFYVLSNDDYTLNVYSDDDTVDPSADDYLPQIETRRLPHAYYDVQYGNTTLAGQRSYFLSSVVLGGSPFILNNGVYQVRFKGTLEFIRSQYDRAQERRNPNFDPFYPISPSNSPTYTAEWLVRTEMPTIRLYWSNLIDGEYTSYIIDEWTPDRNGDVTQLREIETEFTLNCVVPAGASNWWNNAGVQIQVEYPYGVSAWNLTLKSGAQIKVNKRAEVVEGHTVNLANTLPDVKVSKLYQGFAHCFNLYADTNEFTRDIKIEPRDDFYGNFTDALDWTDKVDINAPYSIEYVDAYNRTLVFKYKSDGSDKLVNRYETVNDALVGGGEVDLSERFSEGSTELENPFFSATMHNRIILGDADDFVQNDKKHIIPVLWNSIGWDNEPPEPAYSFNPRILSYDWSLQTDNDGNFITWKFNDSTESKIPTGYFTDTVNDSNIDNANLHYGGTDGLIDTYYGGRLALLNEGVKVKMSLNLNKEDIRRLDLSQLIYLSAPSKIAGYYAIEKIVDYKPSSKSMTRVVFQKVVNTNPAKANNKWHEDIIKWGSLDDKRANDIYSDKRVFDLADQVEKIKAYLARHEANLAGATTQYLYDGTQYTSYDPLQNVGTYKDSVVLKNGTGNYAIPKAGSMAMGNGSVALGIEQIAIGNYNDFSTTDKFVIGAGTSDTDRVSAVRIDKNGRPKFYGGGIYMEDSNGNIVEVITQVDGEYDKVYLERDNTTRYE